ncbi:hypothetical protein KY360_01785 [Candidatus Woesearchaeota archaeon]|nr:hypothetical protein [Candidatus Woesearchaeota archaeon]
MAKEITNWSRMLATLNFDRFNSIPDRIRVENALKNLNSRNLKVVGIIGENALVLKKQKIDYKEIGKIMNKWVLENFDVKKR